MSEPAEHRAWRYARFGPVEQVLALQSLPCPSPAHSELLVRVHHAAVNPLDWKLVQGQYRWLYKSKPPCGVGSEFTGEVIALGAQVDGFALGQRVIGRRVPSRQPPGAFAEQVTVPAAQAVPLPDGVDGALACTLPVAGVSALEMCRMARVQRGTRVLVHGAAGGVGNACVLWARRLGAMVTATGGPDSQRFLQTLQPARVVDYRTPVAQWGGPFDAVLDCVALLGARELAALLPQGGHAVATQPRGAAIVLDPLLNPWRRMRRHTLMVRSRADDIATMLQAVRDGSYAPPVTQRVPLADAVQALVASRGGHVRGKLVIEVAASSSR